MEIVSNYENYRHLIVMNIVEYDNKTSIAYIELPSVTKSILHSKDLLYPIYSGNSRRYTTFNLSSP